MKLREHLLTLMSEREANKLLYEAKIGKTIIVSGRPGSTGKSTLVKSLNNHGFKAVEDNPEMSYRVELNDYIEKPICGFEKGVI